MCYKLHRQRATWDDAKEACEQGETELASASDEATNNFLSTTFGNSQEGLLLNLKYINNDNNNRRPGLEATGM